MKPKTEIKKEVVCPICRQKPTLDDEDLKGCFRCGTVWRTGDEN